MSSTAPGERPLVLHHYPASPFAEKVRLMLGYKGLRWKSVIIPVIMPKPDVLALTGGYRKTPILQIGADIFCDTALIARVLDRLSSSVPLFPDDLPANAAMIAAWADSTWFSACVAHAAQPAGIRNLFPGATDEQLAAFGEDRRSFRAGGSSPRMSLATAQPILGMQLRRMEKQFLHQQMPFVLGAQATIADFSLYHPLWFIERAQLSAKLLEPYPQVRAWMSRLASFGHGQHESMTSGDAIAMARAQTQATDAAVQGQRVKVAATDYGVDPSEGVLVSEGDDSWVIARTDPRAGTVRVHFPRIGYSLTPA